MRRIVLHETTESTNDDARRLAAEGAPEGTVVLADRQSAGRGRRGRRWDSPDQLGVYLSVLIRPAEPPSRIGRYAIAAAVAACEASREFAGERVRLKWPNDVLAGGRKLAGILAERRQGSLGADLVLGFGINANQLGDDFSPALRGSATSLLMLRDGLAVDRESVAAELLRSLAVAITQVRSNRWADVAERFLSYAPDATGRRVRLATGGEGWTSGLDGSGALRVATDDGFVLAHASESVTLLEE